MVMVREIAAAAPSPEEDRKRRRKEGGGEVSGEKEEGADGFYSKGGRGAFGLLN